MEAVANGDEVARKRVLRAGVDVADRGPCAVEALRHRVAHLELDAAASGEPQLDQVPYHFLLAVHDDRAAPGWVDAAIACVKPHSSGRGRRGRAG